LRTKTSSTSGSAEGVTRSEVNVSMREPMRLSTEASRTGREDGIIGAPMSNESTDGWTIAEAAQQLGISTEALRKRLQRGQIRGYKRGRQWFVLLGVSRSQDRTPGRQNGSPVHEAGQQDTRSSHQDSSSGRQDPGWTDEPLSSGQQDSRATQSEIAAGPQDTIVLQTGQGERAVLELVRLVRDQEHQITQLAGQVGYLQAQLHGTQEQLKALQAPTVEPQSLSPQVSAEQSAPAPRRPWWLFWRAG
jgi:excisionase family DNA binding protein